jgi:hypothetical protein
VERCQQLVKLDLGPAKRVDPVDRPPALAESFASPTAAPAASVSSRDVRSRLQVLEDLLDEKLITSDEYQTRRGQILHEI